MLILFHNFSGVQYTPQLSKVIAEFRNAKPKIGDLEEVRADTVNGKICIEHIILKLYLPMKVNDLGHKLWRWERLATSLIEQHVVCYC